jgi:hypothetical protein
MARAFHRTPLKSAPDFRQPLWGRMDDGVCHRSPNFHFSFSIFQSLPLKV